MIAVSLPITCALTWSTTSGRTGLTLPGMIEEPFWSFGQEDLADPGARARAHEREVVGDLGQRHRDHLQRTGQLDQRVTVGLRLERVLRRADSSPVSALSVSRTLDGEVAVRVEAGAGRGSAERDLGHVRQRRLLTALAAEPDLRGVAGELLADA